MTCELTMSPRYCVVLGCRNSITNCKKRKSECIFFNFPLNQKYLTDKWLRKLNLEGWVPGPESLVCEEHFSLDSFEMVDNKRVLQSGAVPNIIDELEQILSYSEILLNSQNEEILSDLPGDEDLRCRICTAFINSHDAVNVYSEDEKIIVKILACIPILMNTSDFLPKYVCRMCLSDLNTSYRMLMRAIESQKFFNNLLMQKSDNDVIIAKEGELYCENLFNFLDGQSQSQLNEMAGQDTLSERRRESQCNHAENDLSEPTQQLDGEIEKRIPTSSIVEVENCDTLNPKQNLNDQKCSICNMFFSDAVTLKSHIDNCCEKSSLSKQISKPPDRVSDLKDCSLFTCHYCSTSYENEKELSVHLETHIVSEWCEDSSVNEKYTETENACSATSICKICFIAFATSRLLWQHLKSKHGVQFVGNITSRKYTCTECGREFINKNALIIHERNHTGARPFVCENCSSSFKSQANLIQHLVIHSGVKKYNCPVCQKAFARKAFVDAHMRVHTGERPFKCNICESTYTQVGDLNRHMQRCQRQVLSEKKIGTRKNYCRKPRRVRNCVVNAS